MAIPLDAKVCPICDWPHVETRYNRPPITQVLGPDPLVPPRHEWPFGGEGITDAFIDRHGRLCFEYAD